MNDDEAPSRHGHADSQTRSSGLARRLTPDQRRQLDAATPPVRDGLIHEMRLQHLRGSLDEAVEAGRLTRIRAHSYLDRFTAGEDPHRLQRELRRSGILPRRTVTTAAEDLDKHDPPTALEESTDLDEDSTTPIPRWVKGFGIAGIVLVILIVIMLLTGHGPGRHMHGASPTTNLRPGIAAERTQSAPRWS